MKCTQRVLLVLAALLLVACDTSEKPRSAEVVATVPAPELELTPEVAVPARVVAKPVTTAPTLTVKVAPPTIKPIVKSAVEPAVEPVKLALDLSLPATAISSPPPAKPFAALATQPSLLPPLFIDRSEEPSRFQLHGRLVTDQTINEITMDAVTGAELQFEFKQ